MITTHGDMYKGDNSTAVVLGHAFVQIIMFSCPSRLLIFVDHIRRSNTRVYKISILQRGLHCVVMRAEYFIEI